MFLKETCFSDCWKASLVVPVFKNVWERSTTKNYRPVSLLLVVSKVFEKLKNNRLFDHCVECGQFCYCQCNFRSCRSTAGLLIFVSDRIARLLISLALLEAQHFIYPRLLTGFVMLVFFTNCIKYLTLFRLFSVIDGFE